MSGIPKSLKDAVVVFADSDKGNTLTLELENGDLSISVPSDHFHSLDRGRPGNLIEGEFTPITWSMTLQYKEWTGSVSVADVVSGTASGWDFSLLDDTTGGFSGLTLAAGTDTLSAASFSVFQIEITWTDPIDAGTQVVTLANCVGRIDFSEGMPSTVSLSGECYMTRDGLMTNIVTT